jgi:hypothetical protein
MMVRDEDVAERRQGDSCEDELASDTIAAIDDVRGPIADDDLRSR